jgi:hypothetical protein
VNIRAARMADRYSPRSLRRLVPMAEEQESRLLRTGA